jgi:hypothetical protein
VIFVARWSRRPFLVKAASAALTRSCLNSGDEGAVKAPAKAPSPLVKASASRRSLRLEDEAKA